MTEITEIHISQILPGSANQLIGANAGGTVNEYKTVSGTSNQITVTNGVGTMTLSLPTNVIISGLSEAGAFTATNGGVTVLGSLSSVPGYINLYDISQSHDVTISAPTSLTSYQLTLPIAQGSSGQTLSNDGSGNLSWISQSQPFREDYIVGTASGNYTGSTTVFNLINSYVVGSHTLIVTVDGVVMTLGSTADYLETNSTTVTFNNALVTGERVSFIFSQPAGATSGIVNSGTTGQIAYYATGGTIVSGENTVPISAGGTNSSTALSGNMAIVSNSTEIVESPTTTATEIGYVHGVTSSIQTQINSKQSFLVYNVKDYGALGNGSNDDTTAIQNAINAVAAGSYGGTVVFPPGTYIISSAIIISSNQITLQGITTTWRDVPPVIRSSSISTDVLTVNSTTDGVYIKNLTFDRSSSGNSTSKTINVTGATHITFDSCSWGGSKYGLYVANGGGLYIQSCNAYPGGTFGGTNIYGIYIDGTSYDWTGVEIHQFGYISNSTSDTVYAYADIQTGGTNKGCGDRRIFGFETSGQINYGIYLSDGGGFSSDVIIDGISFDDIIDVGITIMSTSAGYAQQANITNGWINLAAASATGIILTKRDNTNISNITIASSATSDIGIALSHASYGTINNCNFTGSANFADGITLDSNSTYNIITANTTLVTASISNSGTNNLLFTGSSLISPSSNTATVGFIRLANADSLAWRNDANSGNLSLATDSSDRLLYDGNVIASTTGLANVGTTNQITVTNSAGGSTLSLPSSLILPGTLEVSGNLSFSSASYGIVGLTGGSQAASGNVGQVVSSNAALGSATTSTNYGDITSIILSAGNWLISGNVDIRGSTITQGGIGISTTSGNSSTGLTYASTFWGLPLSTSSSDSSGSFTYIVSISGSTTYYLKYQTTWSASAPSIGGTLAAIRIS